MCSCVGCYLIKKCIKSYLHTSLVSHVYQEHACIPLVCRVLIGSYEDLHKGDPITQVCNQKSETELRQGRVILHNSKYMQ